MTPRLSPIPPQLIPVDIFITECDNVTYIMIQVRRPHKCDDVTYIMIQVRRPHKCDDVTYIMIQVRRPHTCHISEWS